jgi:MFS family permease
VLSNLCKFLISKCLEPDLKSFYGYSDVAVISGAQKYMQEDLNMTNTQIEILSGILNLASLFGSFAASYTSDRIGRRATITIASAIFFVGSLIMTFAASFVILMVLFYHRGSLFIYLFGFGGTF